MTRSNSKPAAGAVAPSHHRGTLTVTLQHAMLLGGRSDPPPFIDAATARDKNGAPFIPASALRGALREDPDIILVGEMRDLETISLAIEAASTGHLVFGTLHTTSAAKTVDRVIEVFPVNQQEQIRNTLADGIRAVVAQTLFRRRDRKGRVAALEIMIANPAVRNLIREGKTFQIPSMLQTGKKYGMQTLDDAIMELLKKKIIDADDAYSKANEKQLFLPYLKNPPSDFTEV